MGEPSGRKACPCRLDGSIKVSCVEPRMRAREARGADHTWKITTALVGGAQHLPEGGRPELRRGFRGHHPGGGAGQARLGLESPVSGGAGAGEYLARSERDSDRDLRRLCPCRLVGWRAGRAGFHPARVCAAARLDPALSALWRAATHAPCVLWAESGGGGDLRHVRVPAGPGRGAHVDTCPPRGRQCPGHWPHATGHRPDVAPGGCRRDRPVRFRAPGVSSPLW
jgi:hypothetical protein